MFASFHVTPPVMPQQLLIQTFIWDTFGSFIFWTIQNDKLSQLTVFFVCIQWVSVFPCQGAVNTALWETLRNQVDIHFRSQNKRFFGGFGPWMRKILTIWNTYLTFLAPSGAQWVALSVCPSSRPAQSAIKVSQFSFLSGLSHVFLMSFSGLFKASLRPF